MNRRWPLALSLFSFLAVTAQAETSNGNEFALAMSEAKTLAAKKAVFETAVGRPHFFRYLQIMDLQPGANGVKITAFEPSSYLDVKFTVTMPVSLAKLREAPAAKIGDALAVTGRVVGVEPGKLSILLESPIVRFKDRLSPARGAELLSDVDPGAIFYSYTEGPRPVMLESRDRDLLSRRNEVLAQGGPKAWTEFLEGEIAKRKEQRAAAAKEGAPK